MKRRKPGSIVAKAEVRLKGMTLVDKNLQTIIDYGGIEFPLTCNDVKTQIEKCLTANNNYNEALKIAEEVASIVNKEEATLTEMYSRILSGCVSKFGVDAKEVTLLGGTRLSERKKSVKNEHKQ